MTACLSDWMAVAAVALPRTRGHPVSVDGCNPLAAGQLLHVDVVCALAAGTAGGVVVWHVARRGSKVFMRGLWSSTSKVSSLPHNPAVRTHRRQSARMQAGWQAGGKGSKGQPGRQAGTCSRMA